MSTSDPVTQQQAEEAWSKSVAKPSLPSSPVYDEVPWESVPLRAAPRPSTYTAAPPTDTFAVVALKSVPAPAAARPSIAHAEPGWSRDGLAQTGIDGLVNPEDDQTRDKLTNKVSRKAREQRARHESKNDEEEEDFDGFGGDNALRGMKRSSIAPALMAAEPVADPAVWRNRLASKELSPPTSPTGKSAPASPPPVILPMLRCVVLRRAWGV